MTIGRLLRKAGLCGALGAALLAWGPARGLAGPEDCSDGCAPACCPAPPKHHHKGPRIKLKTGCDKPTCDPCLIPHAGYFPTCWEAKPWGFEHTRCVPPPSDSFPEAIHGHPSEAPSPMPRAEEVLPLPMREPGTGSAPMAEPDPARPDGMSRLPGRLQGRMPILAGWIRRPGPGLASSPGAITVPPSGLAPPTPASDAQRAHPRPSPDYPQAGWGVPQGRHN